VHLYIGYTKEVPECLAHKILDPELNLLLGSTLGSNPEALAARPLETKMRTVSQKE
jgi:hypothetical protein